ncbi:hypothetical protein PS934_00130 [Pseudomonas fluorescens]|uniref:hypothetical protein n=1 Tax=Pseudomonas fluorescens TaxID=294 RepID=UPI00124048C5|nr:hypothetical protein [Pseudomonas fluorescens]VVP74924.1 hypothetical protein PS934_00130 [Pseudomonas fluorescens]
MGLIEVKQRDVIQIQSLKSKWVEGVTIPANPPKLLWVVYEGEKIAGIFSTWEEASILVGALYWAQQTRQFLREKALEEEKKNPGTSPKPSD